MNTNVTLLRGNAAAPALWGSRAPNLKQNPSFARGRAARMPERAALIMLWRTNPASGRLECSWVTDQRTATDEGVSCSDLRQAA